MTGIVKDDSQSRKLKINNFIFDKTTNLQFPGLIINKPSFKKNDKLVKDEINEAPFKEVRQTK